MPTPESAAGVLVQRTMMIDDDEDHDVARLEELLRAQSKRVHALEDDLHRRGRLLRQLTEQISAASPGASCMGADERVESAVVEDEGAAWMRQAIDAEAARVELLLRLEMMQSRLQWMEAAAHAAQDQAPLLEAVDDAQAALDAAQFRTVELERELSQVQQERVSLAQKVQQQAKALQEVEAQVERLRAAAEQARERMDSLSRQAAELEARHTADQQQALSEQRAQLLSQYRAQSERAERELKVSRDKLDELGQSLSAARLEAEAALSREDAAREELSALRQQRAAELDQMQSAQRALSDLRDASAAEMGEVENRLRELEEELQTRGQVQEGLRSEGESLREQVQVREDALSGAQAELATQRHRAERLEQLRDQLQAELTSTRTQLSALAASASEPMPAPSAEEARAEDDGTAESMHQQAPEQLVAQLVQANRLLQNLRAALVKLAAAHEHDAEGGHVASRATLAGTTDAVSADVEPSDGGDQRMVDLEGALELEKRGRGEDRREARRQIHALKTECQIMRARFEDEQARINSAIKAAQAIQKDLLPGDPMYGRLAEVLTALEGNG